MLTFQIDEYADVNSLNFIIKVLEMKIQDIQEEELQRRQMFETKKKKKKTKEELLNEIKQEMDCLNQSVKDDTVSVQELKEKLELVNTFPDGEVTLPKKKRVPRPKTVKFVEEELLEEEN